MKKIGLFYSFNTRKSNKAAEAIAAILGKDVEKVNAETVTEEQFLKYDNLILSSPTWFDGELANYWDEFVPAIEDLDLKGKKIAIFGLGDQKGYPENFVDAIGILGDILAKQGAEIVGFTPNKEYTYESSKAAKGTKFKGLALDYVTQKDKSEERIKNWCEQLKSEFN